MDSSNLNDILDMNKDKHKNIHKLRDFDLIQKGADVPDPYYGGAQGFQEVYDIINRSTLQLLTHLQKEH
jgi:protein-tyrosine phosphatase